MKLTPPPAVVSGQQIGLLGGPLYVAYKILGVAKLAKAKNQRAVYWVETNDSDRSESNWLTYLDRQHQVKTLIWTPTPNPPTHTPIGNLKVDHRLIALLQQFLSALPQTSHSHFVRQLIFSCYQPGEDLGTATLRLLKQLFKDFAVEFFDPRTPAFVKFSQALLQKAAYATPENQQCPVFLLKKGLREALFKHKGGFITRWGTTATLTEGRLLPHLKTRSVLQDKFFNASHYLAGPGELAYLPTLAPVYRFFQVTPAKPRARMSTTLLPPAFKTIIHQLGIAPSDYTLKSAAELGIIFLRQAAQFEAKKLHKTLTAAKTAYLDTLEAAGVFQAQSSPARKRLERLLHAEQKALVGHRRRALKQRHSAALQQIATLSNFFYPRQQPQERAFNLFYFLNAAGPTLLQYLYENYSFTKTAPLYLEEDSKKS